MRAGSRAKATTLLFAAGLALAAGCATVKPWDKETLSEPCMEFGSDSASRPFMAHALITNEEAVGGEGGSGGGCGCR